MHVAELHEWRMHRCNCVSEHSKCMKNLVWEVIKMRCLQPFHLHNYLHLGSSSRKNTHICSWAQQSPVTYFIFRVLKLEEEECAETIEIPPYLLSIPDLPPSLHPPPTSGWRVTQHNEWGWNVIYKVYFLIIPFFLQEHAVNYYHYKALVCNSINE